MDTEKIEKAVLQITKNMEKRVDETIDLMDNMNTNDFEQLRKQRLQELKQQQNNKKRWLQNGHGVYEELAEEKTFFDAVKKSENVVVHFFTPSNARSPILDMHLKIVAPKHMETRIVSLNAEKCPFLAERLSIKVIPLLVCVQNGIVVDKIVGFASLGNTDDFPTEILEWRLGHSKIINYEGDLSVLPELVGKKEKAVKRAIRDGFFENQSDDDLELDSFPHDPTDAQPVDVPQNEDKKYNPYNLTADEARELGLDDDD